MSYLTIAAQGSATITLTAGQKIAIRTQGEAQVFQQVGFPNYPDQLDLLATVTSGNYTSSAFANGATVVVNAGAFPVLYDVGTDATVGEGGDWQVQGAPNALDATGNLTAAMMLGGLVTSVTTAAVVATPPTGTVLDAATQLAVNDSFNFSVINTGASNTFTISVGGGVAGCTLVGNMVVGTTSSGQFRVRKTAAATYTIYRIAS